MHCQIFIDIVTALTTYFFQKGHPSQRAGVRTPWTLSAELCRYQRRLRALPVIAAARAVAMVASETPAQLYNYLLLVFHNDP